MQILSVLFGIGIILALFYINVYLYRANKKTPVPEGCENLKPDCAACGIEKCAIRDQKESEG